MAILELEQLTRHFEIRPGFIDRVIHRHPAKYIKAVESLNFSVAEDEIADPEANAHVQSVSKYAKEHHGSGSCVICARLEAELSELSPEEAKEYVAEIGCPAARGVPFRSRFQAPVW